MTTRAITIVQERGGWRAHMIDIEDADDLDHLVDMIRDLGGHPSVTFVEEDDEYLAVIRLDETEDPRVFLSDQRALFTSRVANRLFADALPSITEIDPDEDTEGGLSHATPVGDLDLLSDLGTGPDALIEIITARGVLPSDAVAMLAERAGCGDLLDEVGG